METKSGFLGDNKASNTILIVDDDQINRTILGKIFAPYYHVKEAVDGEQAVNALLDQKSRFCAILLDVHMPGMTGIEIVRWMKMYNMLEKIPVFLITAEDGEGMMREAYELGVMDVIRKPVISYMVQRRVRSVIELFEARKQLSAVVETQNEALLLQAQKIIQLNQGLIEALATAIEFRNEESGGHVQRISTITRMILENTDFGQDLNQSEIDNIVLASTMHDVGKITIPDAVLCKPGKLTEEEYEIMKTHTTNGVVILERIPQLKDGGIYNYACDIARHHHERWDGRGYPDGLKGEQISLWAQVVSLADVYDALSCKRVYKDAFPRHIVLEMIVTGQCGQFNPKLLQSFFTIEGRLFELYHGVVEDENFVLD